MSIANYLTSDGILDTDGNLDGIIKAKKLVLISSDSGTANTDVLTKIQELESKVAATTGTNTTSSSTTAPDQTSLENKANLEKIIVSSSIGNQTVVNLKTHSSLVIGANANSPDVFINGSGDITSTNSDLKMNSFAGNVLIQNRNVLSEIDDLKNNTGGSNAGVQLTTITSSDAETKKTLHLDSNNQVLHVTANSLNFQTHSSSAQTSLTPAYSKTEELTIPAGLNQGFRDDVATHPNSNTPKTWELQFITNSVYGSGSSTFFTTGYVSAGDPNLNLISVYFNDKPPQGGLVVYTSGAGQEGFIQKDVIRNNYADGKYHHLVCTLDPATRIFNIYLDNQLKFTHTFTSDLQIDHDSDGVILGMNGHQNTFGDSINGKIKNFYLYDKILTTAEIQSRFEDSNSAVLKSYTNLNGVGQINSRDVISELNRMSQQIEALRSQLDIVLKGDYTFPSLRIGKPDYDFLIRPADINSQDNISDVNRRELYIMAPVSGASRPIISSHSNQNEFIVNGRINHLNGTHFISQLPSGNQNATSSNDAFVNGFNQGVGYHIDTIKTGTVNNPLWS